MPSTDTKVVQLFPARGAQDTPPDLRCREMGRDIASLQDLTHRLQQIRAPLREASHTFLSASRGESRQHGELKLTGFDTLLDALEASMKELYKTWKTHQDAIPHHTRIHG